MFRSLCMIKAWYCTHGLYIHCMGSNKKTILFVQVARFLPTFAIWETFLIFALAFVSEVASSKHQDTLQSHMLSVCYLADVQTPWRNTHKNCPDQRTTATKLCRCVNDISGAGQRVKVMSFEGSVFSGYLLCGCWLGWICFHEHFKSSNDSFSPAGAQWDYVYAVVSNLCGEFLRLELSASHRYLSCSPWQRSYSFMETRNLLWDSLKITGVFLEAKIYISVKIRLIFFSSFVPV